MGNTIIKANCLDQRLILSSTPLIASGGVNENIAEFDFCPLWDGFSKTAIFYRNETEKYYAIVDSENKCVIPWEVLQSDGKLFFGVYGVKGGVRRTSEILGYKIKLGAFDEKLKPSEPTPDIYSQYVNKITSVENRMIPVEEFTIKPAPYELTGNPVQMKNYEGMPFGTLETQLSLKQGGSGDPSPTNIRPISGYDRLSLTRCGKSLFSVDEATFTRSKTYELQGILPAGRYIFSATVVSDDTGSSMAAVVFRKLDGNQITKPIRHDGTRRTIIVDLPEAIKAIRLQSGTSYDDSEGDISTWSDVQLELETATDYEPYQGDDYTVQIGQTVCGGRMNWLTGEFAVEYNYIELTGNEDIGIYSSSATHPNSIIIRNTIPNEEYRAEGVASHALVHKYLDTSGRIVVGNNSKSVYWMDILDIFGMTSVEEFIAWVKEQKAAGTPVQIAYKPSSPTVIQFTPQQITALDGTNTFYGNGEITVVGRKDIIWLTSALIERIKTLEEAIISLGGNV